MFYQAREKAIKKTPKKEIEKHCFTQGSAR